MPRTTSLTSAPTASQTAAMALTKLILAARKALEAYLIVSADAGSVTMRPGLRKSWTAEPSRKNSGLDTTTTSSRPSTRSTTRVDPTGTVDLLTTTASDGSTGPISRAAASM